MRITVQSSISYGQLIVWQQTNAYVVTEPILILQDACPGHAAKGGFTSDLCFQDAGCEILKSIMEFSQSC